MHAILGGRIKEDAFARTFASKCNMLEGWDKVIGAFDESGELAAAILVTISKRAPHVANLQLLHTFFRFRRQGAASQLCRHVFSERGPFFNFDYFRVSSEPESVGFYRSLGFKFWGLQKSGTSLSIFKVGGLEIKDGVYDKDDEVIKKAVFTTRKGGVHKHFKEPE